MKPLFFLALFYQIPTYSASTFESTQDFVEFFDQQTLTRPASWPSISPRSYVVAVDFTLSEEHGVRVLELGGPLYASSLIDIKPIRRDPLYLERFFRHFGSNVQVYAGSEEHSLLYPDIHLQSRIHSSAEVFAQEYGWNLVTVKSEQDANVAMRLFNRRKKAVIPIGFGVHEVNWNELSRYPMIFNHPGIATVAYYKHIQATLPVVPGVSIPSTFFATNTYKKNPHILSDFIARNRFEHYILKPIDSYTSNGVFLVTREMLEKPTHEMHFRHLSNYKAWVLQAYMPSTPVSERVPAIASPDKLFTPTGRIFYHIIYDGSRLRMIPLTAYQRINSYQSSNASDFYDPEKVRFSVLPKAQEYSREQLLTITRQLNHYFSQTSQSLFELSQSGNAKIKTQTLINRLASLKPYEQEVLSLISRYLYLETNRPSYTWMDRLFRLNLRLGISLFENRMYRIARGSYTHSCSKYFKLR